MNSIMQYARYRYSMWRNAKQQGRKRNRSRPSESAILNSHKPRSESAIVIPFYPRLHRYRNPLPSSHDKFQF